MVGHPQLTTFVDLAFAAPVRAFGFSATDVGDYAESLSLSVTTLRGGKATEVPSEQIVPGDIVTLSPGDLVPADGIVIASRAGRVNEALLTGEPYPVEKRCGNVASPEAAEASNAVFRGAVAQTGEAVMLVAGTGRSTVFGTAAAALALVERYGPPGIR